MAKFLFQKGNQYAKGCTPWNKGTKLDSAICKKMSESKIGKDKKEKYYEIDEKTGCWNWIGAINKYGYAVIKRFKKSQHASRYYYEKYRNKIPEGMQIDHLCFNPKCVNPDHLEVVTSAENCRRRRSTKLDYAKVEEIRNLYKSCDIKQSQLANSFNVGQDHISRIVNNRVWVLSS